MKLLFASLMFASAIPAVEMDAQLLRLIGPNARAAFGIDSGKYRLSVLAEMYPARSTLVPIEATESGIWQLIEVLDGQSSLTILQGTLPPLAALMLGGDEPVAFTLRRGVPVVSDGFLKLALLNPNTA